MRNIILMLFCVALLFNLPVCEGGYVYTGDATLKEKPLPINWKAANGSWICNFNLLSQSVHNAEGWFEVTVDNSGAYDPDIHAKGAWTYTIFSDHAEKARIITSRPLNVIRKWKGRQIIAEGKALLDAKYPNGDWSSGYTTDKAKLVNYFRNTIKGLIIGAATGAEIKALNNGDEYTWPNI